MNTAQHLLLSLGVDPFLLMRHGGKREHARKRGPGRVYVWGRGRRVDYEGNVRVGFTRPGTRRLRRGQA